MKWKNIEDLGQLKDVINESFDSRVIIFKHSTRCPISSMMLRRFEKQLKEDRIPSSYYFVDLIRYRSVSNAIAETLSVTHQSPQIIVLKNGNAVYDASHSAIDLETIPSI